MAIRFYQVSTPGTRNRSVLKFEEISKSKPEKSLTRWVKRAKGRNHRGIITCRHRGGGHKRCYRKIDFHRNKLNVFGKVKSIEYDPNRNSQIALVHYLDGDKGYILHPLGLKIGDRIIAGENAPISTGNSLPLRNMPLGTEIHNVEFQPGSGGKLARAAGSVVQLVAKEGRFVTIRLPSGEIRLISNKCWATIGQVGNTDTTNLIIGKAGRKRWLGRRPEVRGSVMNPVDHPHGGGEGRAPIGRNQPLTPWGKPALGTLTRKKKKYSRTFILRKRK